MALAFYEDDTLLWESESAPLVPDEAWFDNLVRALDSVLALWRRENPGGRPLIRMNDTIWQQYREVLVRNTRFFTAPPSALAYKGVRIERVQGDLLPGMIHVTHLPTGEFRLDQRDAYARIA